MWVLDPKAGRTHLQRAGGRVKVEDADEMIQSPPELPEGEDIMGDPAQILMAIQMSSGFSEAMGSVGSSTDTDVKATVETIFRLDDIASEFGEDYK